MLGPLPRWSQWCTYTFLPIEHRPSSLPNKVGTQPDPQNDFRSAYIKETLKKVKPEQFVSDSVGLVKASDIVKVKVLEVDEGRKRIALTMRLDDSAKASQSDKANRQQRAERKGGANNKGGKPQHRSKQGNKGQSAMGGAFAKAKKK